MLNWIYPGLTFDVSLFFGKKLGFGVVGLFLML
jgi:hypothetical protein